MMNLAELRRQIMGVHRIIHRLLNGYWHDGYRIEQEVEQVKGVYLLGNPCRDGAEEDPALLAFLLDEEKRMVGALSKCHNRIVGDGICPYDAEEWDEDDLDAHAVRGILKKLCREPEVRKQVQKAEGGYDMIITQTSRIDRELLHAIYRRINQDCGEIQDIIARIGRMETDYEATIDYTQSVGDCLRELKEMGVLAE